MLFMAKARNRERQRNWTTRYGQRSIIHPAISLQKEKKPNDKKYLSDPVPQPVELIEVRSPPQGQGHPTARIAHPQ
jgi:hypothetical protein